MAVAVCMAMLSSCKPRVPSRYIQPDDMEDLLHDLHIAQAMANEAAHKEGSLGYQQNLYFAAVLEKHGVTKAEFDSSLTYYYVRADRFSDMYKHVVDRLSNEAMALGASEGEISRYANLNSANGDTTNIWAGALSAVLVPYAPFNLFTFEQKADTSFRKGDSFMFIANTDYIFQSGSRNVQACIAVRYDNDTVVSRTSSMSSSGITQIRVPELAGRQATDIRGFIYMAVEKEPTTVLKLLSIKDLQLIKFRKQQLKTENNESENPSGPDELSGVRRVGSVSDVHGPVLESHRNGL